jgi:hypothetical protein
MTSGKAIGMDGIPVEQYKVLVRDSMQAFHHVLTIIGKGKNKRCLRTSVMPE